VSSRNPYIDWPKVEDWYATVIEAARLWSDIYESLVAEDAALAVSTAALQEIEAQILAGQDHVQKAVLKASETILKRPGRRLTEPQDLRFLLIITANPLLHAAYKPYAGKYQPASAAAPRSGSGPTSGRHSVIIKRIVGLMSNTPVECHSRLIAWFARYSEPSFVQTKDLVSGFLAYRLIRQNEKKYQTQIDFTGGLIPSMGPSESPASLHAALGHSQRANKKQQEKKRVVYQEDWQIKAAAQVLGFLFAANNMSHARRGHLDSSSNSTSSPGNRHPREQVQAPGQILATSDFYMTLLDDSDLIADFEVWERKQSGRFSFCQHPFLLSIGAKIQILEHDARKQMETKARDAFFDSIMTNRVVQQFLVLSIRRECLVDDSLKAVSVVIGGGGEDIKKGLKINFKGEEGVDAGGLRKEWFLLLVREVFNPDHGMFLWGGGIWLVSVLLTGCRHVPLRRRLALLLLQPQLARAVRAVLPGRRRPRPRHLQLDHPRRRPPALCLPQAPRRGPSTHHPNLPYVKPLPLPDRSHHQT
jgi:E3 ubiquitin-protein ligase HECTD2